MRTIRRLLVTVAVATTPLLASATAHASDDATYVVRSGDSLYGIAHRLQIPVNTLLSKNGLEVTSVIMPGQTLKVPAGTTTTPNASSSGGGTPSGATSGTYTVRPGDSLSGIAARHKVGLGSLLSVNGITITSVIHPGQELKLPAGATAPASSNSSTSNGGATTNGGSATSAGSASTYTVRAGDSLSGIAYRHQVSLGSLLAVNGLTLNSFIHPDQQLELPAGATAPATSNSSASNPQTTPSDTSGDTYTVRSGDSLMAIANRHGTSLASLLSVNNLSVTSLILPGQQLALPAGATAPSGDGTSTAATSGNARIDAVVNYALAQQGKPYAFFTKGPHAFDCSGLVVAAYAQVGVTMIHYSAAQALQGTGIDFYSEPIKAGDLIFMKRHGSEVINHVGIAISSTQWIQAVGTGQGVRVGSMPAKGSIASVRRIIG